MFGAGPGGSYNLILNVGATALAEALEHVPRLRVLSLECGEPLSLAPPPASPSPSPFHRPMTVTMTVTVTGGNVRMLEGERTVTGTVARTVARTVTGAEGP